ncbi:hypothetical protein SLEP1_g15335 [Rubroshorea leprosula]|uniref:Uncharacterized protein n=1 Tax=Rubroshorea leprosula TaxID=152421 RepID=A0AAV5IYQ8_9ROSI|nr:hypothetical protein SLEP1_g15335 [Rubroshorea leprosula]
MSSLPVAHFRFSALAMRFPYTSERSLQPPLSFSFPSNLSLRCGPMGISSARLPSKFEVAFGGGNGNNGVGNRGSGGRGGNNGGSGGESGDGNYESDSNIPQNGLTIGWKKGVEADAQLPFKVLMEEVIGITAFVLGDVVLRLNFNFSQFHSVFSTLVIGMIHNSILLFYHLLTSSSATFLNLPAAIFADSPKTHILTAAGFASGLVGTAISNRLIKLAKKVDSEFDLPNYPPSPILNALTWAIHMGISCSLRCQISTGINDMLAKLVPPLAFNTSVLALRCLNGILGGMSFVKLVSLIRFMEKNQRIKDIEKRTREKEMNFKLSEERKMTLRLSPANPLFTFWMKDKHDKGQIVHSAGFNILVWSMLFTHTITEEEETD